MDNPETQATVNTRYRTQPNKTENLKDGDFFIHNKSSSPQITPPNKGEITSSPALSRLFLPELHLDS